MDGKQSQGLVYKGVNVHETVSKESGLGLGLELDSEKWKAKQSAALFSSVGNTRKQTAYCPNQYHIYVLWNKANRYVYVSLYWNV